MALKFADRLESNNPKAYGIVKAVEVSGHKTVSSISALIKLPDCILSVSGNNTDNDAIGQLWYVVDQLEIYQLIDWDKRHEESGWSIYGADNITEEELEKLLEGKQDKLTAGYGIEISPDNVISCTLDTTVFVFVDELPPLKEAKEGKIYLVPKEVNPGENQNYVEYIVTTVYDEEGFESKKWEIIGEYDLNIELKPYLKIEDAEKTYVKKSDIVNTLEGGTEEQVLGANMGKELKSQIDALDSKKVNSVTATPEKGIIVEGTQNDPTIGILRNPDSEEFFSISEGGVGVFGIQDAINKGDDAVREEHKNDIDKLKSHTEVLYNINSLFPEMGQGDNKNQWTLQFAISYLAPTLSEEEKIPGVKCKFLDTEEKWRTYTYYGDNFISPDSWNYDLTSKDFEELATTNLPTATQEANGTMSKEDKKKLDTLSSGIEEGVSIVDKINEIVDETKEIIDNYTVNGYKISENPSLTKTDIGLDQVTNDAQVKRSEMGVANGVATLGEDGKVPLVQLPDSVLGNVRYMGTWDASTNTPELIEGNEEDNGHYYIVSNPGTQFGYDFDSGDWVINSNGVWTKVDNVDAVKSVNGKIGVVEIGIDDIPNLTEELDSKALNADLLEHTSNTSNPHNVTKEQVGLGNVDNTSDLDKPISTATLEALTKLQAHTDIVYNVTDLFPDEGQGDNKNQWTLQLAISKLDNYADPKYRIPGVRCKFLDMEGKWKTYTYYGDIFADASSWNYDLTSKDFEELATTNLPTATQEANGTMSKEDKKKLDTLSSGIEEGTTIQDIIDKSVNEAKAELQENIDNVDGKLDSHIEDKNNPHQVTKEQVGLDQVTNDAQVKRSEMGVASGVATLGEDGKVPSSQISDRLLNNVKYLGTWDASTNTPKLENNSISNSGDYYIVSNAGTQFGISFEKDDFIINNGGTWSKMSNNESVTSVNGKTGEVVIEIGDISNLSTELSSKALNSDLESVRTRVETIENSVGRAGGLATLDDQGKLINSQIPDEAINILEGTYVNETTFNNKSGHPYEPVVGIIYVDTVTNKIYRWGESTYIELVNLDGVDSDIQSHIEDKNNPHQVTKEQVGLDQVTNDAQVKRSEMGVAEGVATLDENGKIPVYQIPGQVSEVFGIDHFVDSKDQIPTSRLVIGSTYYVRNDKKIYTATSDTEVDEGITPEKGVIYSNRETNFIYRWDGADLVEIGNPIQLGEVAGSAYPGDKGKETTDKLNEHIGNTSNPHSVTKEQIGLDQVDNTSDLNKPISTATQGALDKITGDVTSHIENKENPHSVTKAQVGLDQVDNTSDKDKPVSDATQALVDSTKNELNSSISSHVGNKNNPHEVTKEQVGLSNVDNTSDLNKPVSTAQQAALDGVKAELNSNISEVKSTVTNHISDKNNPHGVTATQIGLGNVDNTSDANKPVSTAQQAALDKVAGDLQKSIEAVNTELSTHEGRVDNPHSVTKEQVGLGNVDNTADKDKPISTATQTAIDSLKTSLDHNLELHTGNHENPHQVTKEQVGLGNVDNTADRDKPVSTAQQAALTEVDTRITQSLTEHVNNKENPHSVTKEQIGLSNVTNDAQVKRSEMGVANGVATLGEDGKVPSSQLPSFVDDIVEVDSFENLPEAGETGKIYVTKDTNLTYRWAGTRYVEISASLALGETSSTAYPGDKGKETTDKLNEHIGNTSNPHNVTKEQVGLDQVDNTSDKDKPVSDATQALIDSTKTSIEEKINGIEGNLQTHIDNVTNPHNVTKEQIGLDQVDNTSDLNKPISTATQEALDTLKSELEDKISSGGTDLSGHINNYENPHKVTKAQVGLDKVDNTADIDKPVSTATQTAIDLAKGELSTTITSHVNDKNNPHSVTKEQVGLGNVDNTADANKPVSIAQQAAIEKVSSDLTLSLTNHTTNTNNPHQVTAAQIGLGNVNNTADLEKPVSKATQDLITEIKTALDSKITDNTNKLTNHIEDKNNPHSVTKEQIGLGNVDNTSDLNKPISTATQAALDKKADLVDGKVPESQMPNRTLHSLFYKGIWDADINSPKLENDSPEQEGDYYLVRGQGVRFGYEFLPNDVIFNAYGTWFRLSGSNQRDDITKFYITSFTADRYEFEIGESATINFNWDYNGITEGENVSSQSINQYSVPVENRSYSITEVTTDTKFTLTAIYRNVNNAKAELEVKFYNKFYVGAASGDTISDSELIKLDSYFVNGEYEAPLKTIDCDGGKYIYVAIPTDSFGKYSIYANGIQVTDTVNTTRDVTNASGGRSNYTIARFANKYNGEINVEVKLI